MATSLVSTGVQFPDATIQTTAISGSPITTNVRQAVTSSATTAINFASGNTVDLTMAANITTMTFSGVATSGTAMLVQIVVKNDSSGTAYTIVWPTSVYWNAATAGTIQVAPTLATGANGVTVIALLTTDGGTKWRGWVESSIPGGTEYTLYGWGNNTYGVIGIGSTTAVSTPVQVGALTNWLLTNRTGQGQTVAIKTDGTLWTWGYNTFRALGLGNSTSYSSPKQVGTDTNWKSVGCSLTQAMCATKTTGTLWSWGRAQAGVLGQNASPDLSTPTQIGSLTNWSTVSGANMAMSAIKTDGTLWTWGNGAYGLGGRGNTTTVSSPVQVGVATNWATLAQCGNSCQAAITTTGQLWVWGNGTTGQLGLGFSGSISTPVQVGALTNWSKVIIQNSSIALKTDGTLWTWGQGTNGQLGLGSSTYVYSPNQVGAATNWTSITCSLNANFGTRGSSGTGALYAWGLNTTRQLGLGNTTNYSSPVQVGSFTNWMLTGGMRVESGGGAFGIRVTPINPA